MVYRDFKGMKLSALGLGTMRLPKKADGSIDEEQLADMVRYSFEKGINYFDTAWMYHDGQSEICVGRALAAYPRESFYLADKFPGFSVENMENKEKIFQTQLDKCGVEYFDFYLFHSMTASNFEWYMSDEYRLMDYLKSEKARGRIRHIGISSHSNYDMLKAFLDKYREDVEFVQLQVNWFDWKGQEADKRIELLREYGIPLWVMEPLRGGMLADIGEAYKEKLRSMRPDETVPAWGFRFLENVGATMVLSGMSNTEQLKQNIETFSADRLLGNDEWKALLDIAENMRASNMISCTGCGYCTTVCPMEIPIPQIIKWYNKFCFNGVGSIPASTLEKIDEGKRPSVCLGCRACEGICPQEIKVADLMEKINS